MYLLDVLIFISLLDDFVLCVSVNCRPALTGIQHCGFCINIHLFSAPESLEIGLQHGKYLTM